MDADYERFARPKDDTAPQGVAAQLHLTAVRAPLSLEGGNLLSNGRGLCLTTTMLYDGNRERGHTEGSLRKVLRDFFGAQETVFLEPLSGEPTGHVDMFAAFTDANTVVVGQYDTAIDPTNAAVLNRNAARLARIRGPEGPLQVVRIPMPPRDGEQWRTYTNVVFANGVLLTPAYERIDPQGQRAAADTFQRLLPGWRITGIDVSGLIANGGALHCISMNAPRLARWPAFRPSRRPVNNPLGPVARTPVPARRRGG
jgi:agmatine/peptidylarginine deiminase